MQRTTRMPREQRRAQLLDLATRLFSERGYQATSMDDIATAAGVTKPVLYQHFSSKEELFGVVIEIIGERLLENVAALGTVPGTTRERVRLGLTRFYELVSLDDALRLFTGREVISDEVNGRVDEILDQMAVTLAHVLARSRRLSPTDARVLGRGMIALTQTSAVLMHGAADDAEREQTLETMTAVAVGGLTAFEPLDRPEVSGEVSAHH